MEKRALLIAFLLKVEAGDPERGRFTRAELAAWPLGKLQAFAEAIVRDAMQSLAN